MRHVGRNITLLMLLSAAGGVIRVRGPFDNVVGSWKSCAQDESVCKMRMRIESEQGDRDDTGVPSHGNQHGHERLVLELVLVVKAVYVCQRWFTCHET